MYNDWSSRDQSHGAKAISKSVRKVGPDFELLTNWEWHQESLRLQQSQRSFKPRCEFLMQPDTGHPSFPSSLLSTWPPKHQRRLGVGLRSVKLMSAVTPSCRSSPEDLSSHLHKSCPSLNLDVPEGEASEGKETSRHCVFLPEGSLSLVSAPNAPLNSSWREE